MRAQSDMPTEGQFVAMWEHEGEPRAITLRLKDEWLQEYNIKHRTWEVSDLVLNHNEIYYVVD